jgi:carboxyl-terminal processing protease
MKKLIFAIMAVFLGSSMGFAQKYSGSPAQDIFDQASFFLDTQYFGSSNLNISNHLGQYQQKVDLACATQGIECTFETIEPLIRQMFTDLKDPHAYYVSAATVQSQNPNRAGMPTNTTLRLGFSSRRFCQTPTGECVFDGNGQPTSPLLADRFVTGVAQNSPAEQAGLQYGDRLIGYNGVLYSSFNGNEADINQFQSNLNKRVQAGETIRLLVVRGAERRRLEIAMQGAVFASPEAPSLELRADGIAILRLPNYIFQGLGQQVHNLLRQAMARGATGLIINQRGNGGGSVLEYWHTVGALIRSPDWVRRVPRYGAAQNTIEEGFIDGAYVERNILRPEAFIKLPVNNPVLFEKPIAVLVDGGCASACEALASSIQKAKRAPVIGETTVGVANTDTRAFVLINGAAVSMPTLRGYWVDGTPITSTITPDIQTPNNDFMMFQTGVDLGMNKALEAVGVKNANALVSSIEIQGIEQFQGFNLPVTSFSAAKPANLYNPYH